MVFQADYFAFGTKYGMKNETGFEESHGFTGKEYDEDTGLYYFNARWYDAELGRFVSEDPVADPNNPNLYSYCGNQPLNHIDPTGMVYYDPKTGVVSDPNNDGGPSIQTKPVKGYAYGDGVDVVNKNNSKNLPNKPTSTIKPTPTPNFVPLPTPGPGPDAPRDPNQDNFYALKQTTSFALSMTPYLGDAKDGQEVYTGVDWVTGEKLTTGERVTTLVCMFIPVVGGKAL